MKAYKLLRQRSDGLLTPLFINRSVPTPIGIWLQAELHEQKLFKPRKGWHVMALPLAPHLKQDLANGEHRVWCEVEIEDYEELHRCEAQGGLWYIAQRMKIVREITLEEVEQILKERNT